MDQNKITISGKAAGGYTAEIDQTFRGNMEMCSADIWQESR